MKDFDRKMLSTVGLGKYTELVAIAACVGDGLEVAVPYGNQRGWDFLVESGRNWLRVQVKTARSGESCPYVQLNRMGNGKRSKGKLSGVGYTAADVDEIMAVLPETGSVWRVPIAQASGKGLIRLTEAYLWKGQQPVVYGKVNEKRSRVLQLLPEAKPTALTVDNWEILLGYAAGKSQRQIAKGLGVTEQAIHERLARAITAIQPAAQGILKHPPTPSFEQDSSVR